MRSSSDGNSAKGSQKGTRLIVDANILFAALIKDDKASELLFSDGFELFAPTFLLEEFENYKSLLLDKTKWDEQAFITLIGVLKRRITLLPATVIGKHLCEAEGISPDPKDTPYFAAAIAKKAMLWSNDKRLRTQQAIPVVTTRELAARGTR